MLFEEEIIKVKKGDVYLLGEIHIASNDYRNLIEQAFNKLCSPYAGDEYQILQVLALTQIAIQEYDGDYLSHLKSKMSDPSPKNIKALEELFEHTCRRYNLFHDREGVELIKAHAYVTPHSAGEYFSFLNALYCDEFHHGIPEDLPDELSSLQQDIKELGSAQKSRYLPKSTQAVFSCITPDAWGRIIMPHLQMFDDFWRGGDVSPDSFYAQEFSEWLNKKYPDGVSEGGRKRKGASRLLRGHKPYFKITPDDEIILVIPAQRFTPCKENTTPSIIIQSDNDQKEEKLDMRSGKSFYFSKELTISQLKSEKIKLFQKYTITIQSHPNEKILEIDAKDYYYFDALGDNTLLEKSKRPLASGCMVVRKGSELSSSGQIEALDSEISGAQLYSLDLSAHDILSINGKNIDGETQHSIKYEHIKHCTFYHLGSKPIDATRSHPIITMSLAKSSYETAHLIINKRPLRLSSCRAVLKKEFDERVKIQIDLKKLDNMDIQGLYEIKIQSTDNHETIFDLRYLYLPNFYCKISNNNQFIETTTAYISFSKKLELTGDAFAQSVQANNKKEQKYKIDLRQDVNQLQYTFTLDNRAYSLAIRLNRLLICTDRMNYRYDPEREIWHEDIFGCMSFIIPHARTASLHLEHKPQLKRWGQFKSRKKVFEFDADDIRLALKDYDKPKATLVLNYKTDDGHSCELKYEVLRNVWFDYFKLLAKDDQVFIRTQFKGKESCKLEFYAHDQQVPSATVDKLSSGDTALPALNPDVFYDIQQIQADGNPYTLRKVAAIDPSDLTNCRINLNTITLDGENKKLTQQYYYNLQDLQKISTDRYRARLFRGAELLHDHVQIVLEDFREQRISLECFSEYAGSSYVAPLYYDYENYSLVESCKGGYHLHGNTTSTSFHTTIRRIYQSPTTR